VIKLIACLFFLGAEENFLLVNGVTGETVAEMGPSIDTQFSPCSSFKIVLGVMGFDAGVLQDENNPVWEFQEGYDDYLPSWKEPHTPLAWMTNSCLWFSKVLYAELGSKAGGYVASFDYGNQDATGGFFWLNSTLKISPREQVGFLRKLVHGQLPVSEKAIEMAKKVCFREELPGGWKLYGKTGWSGPRENTLQHSYFVGWIERVADVYIFAYLIRDQEIALDKRIPRVKCLLEEASVM